MRRCLFCDQRARSLEHAWPKWMLNVLGGLRRVEVEFADGRRREWQTPALQIKCACADCNNGWMSDLETKCRPLLGAMMSDLSIRLDRAEQHLIAAWCLKTAIVFEATKPTKSFFYTRAERDVLRSELGVPAGTFLWLGRQHRSDFTYCHARGLSQPTRPILKEAYATTFAAGRLVMQIITVRTTPEYDGLRITLDTAPGPWGNAGLIQVRPASSSIRWPPPWSFAEPDLEALSTRFKSPAP